MNKKGTISIIILFLLSSPVFAGEGFFYKEFNLLGGYSDRDGWVDKDNMMASSAGFEYYRKFSSDYGDYMTADLQMRLSYDSKKNLDQAWGIEIHNAWLEYKISPYAKMRIGHFDPAFGLEPVVDTHSTLLQTLAIPDIGFKKDWGGELRGSFAAFDYEAALQLGSGMSIRRRDDSYLASARVGSPAGNNLQGGISAFSGRVLESEGMRTFPKNRLLSVDTIEKKRIGLDGQYLYGPFLFKGEVAYGLNDRREVVGYLTEIDYTVPSHQNWEFELQFVSWINDLDQHSSDDSTLSFGSTYKLSQSTLVRCAYSHDLNMTGKKEEDKFIAQFYFLGA